MYVLIVCKYLPVDKDFYVNSASKTFSDTYITNYICKVIDDLINKI